MREPLFHTRREPGEAIDAVNTDDAKDRDAIGQCPSDQRAKAPPLQFLLAELVDDKQLHTVFQGAFDKPDGGFQRRRI